MVCPVFLLDCLLTGVQSSRQDMRLICVLKCLYHVWPLWSLRSCDQTALFRVFQLPCFALPIIDGGNLLSKICTSFCLGIAEWPAATVIYREHWRKLLLQNVGNHILTQGWRISWGRVLKLSINFKDILSHTHGNFEEQNKVFDSYIIIINYCIIIANAYYNCIITA